MTMSQNTWALVLAAGDGTGLASLTLDDQGRSVPKQCCSLAIKHALIDDAMQPAQYLSPRERTCIIVAATHLRYWQKAVRTLGGQNIQQPRNWGTAIGILLAILHIIKRDHLARIVFLPADHYIRDEAALGTSLQEAAALVVDDGLGLTLVGIEHEGVDPDLAYIAPGRRNGAGGRHLMSFVEKTLWAAIRFAAPRGTATLALQTLCQTLPPVDFSRAVVKRTESTLRLVSARACVWTDLGTPSRVSRVLHGRDKSPSITRRLRQATVPKFLNLARQRSRLATSGRPYNGHQLLSAGQPS